MEVTTTGYLEAMTAAGFPMAPAPEETGVAGHDGWRLEAKGSRVVGTTRFEAVVGSVAWSRSVLDATSRDERLLLILEDPAIRGEAECESRHSEVPLVSDLFRRLRGTQPRQSVGESAFDEAFFVESRSVEAASEAFSGPVRRALLGLPAGYTLHVSVTPGRMALQPLATLDKVGHHPWGQSYREIGRVTLALAEEILCGLQLAGSER
jgi:hypothetical protein